MISKLAVLAALLSFSDAFVVPRTFRPATKLFLEDHIADMIDRELERLRHKNDLDKAWHKKNEAFLKKDLPQEFDFDDSMVMQQVMGPRQKKKDKKLARENPQAYCADRCVATGNCEVFEDIFHFTPQQVMAFCEECVLSDEEEPCDVPEAFFDADKFGGLRP